MNFDRRDFLRSVGAAAAIGGLNILDAAAARAEASVVPAGSLK